MRPRTSMALTVILVGGGLLFGPQAASAQTCIQEVWQAHGNTQRLQCTANDVTLSAVSNVNIISGGSCDPVTGVCRCFLGEQVTFTAVFRMNLTADTRYDVGFYIATDGDPNNDGAITGQCSATAAFAGNTANFINLDAAPDVCGEIGGPSGTAFNPLLVTSSPITTQCVAGPSGLLELEFATTWRQPGSNEVCTTINDVFPGAPSKCNTGVLTVPIIPASVPITVTKDYIGDPMGVLETGGSATYSVIVKNNNTLLPVTLTSLTDVPYGDITAVGGSITATTCVADGSAATCEVLGVIAAGAECSCTFTATVPAGDFPGNFTDVVTGTAVDEFKRTSSDSDDAVVPYRDVEQPPSLNKTVGNKQCQIDVTYNVVVTNGSGQDLLTLNTLNDDVYGNITQVQGNVISTNCSVAQVILPNGNYACQFAGRITSCDISLTDTVTGTATDDDGANYTVTGSATVVVTPPTP